MEWKTVAIPFAAGIKPNSRARLLEQARLLTAQNVFYQYDQGPQKRYGHASRVVRTASAPIGSSVGQLSPGAPRVPFSLDDPNLPAEWLHGFGPIVGDENPSSFDSFPVSEEPNAGLLHGALTRDSETAVWDGHRLFSYAGQQASLFGETQDSAVLPSMRAAPYAKQAAGQLTPDFADNGVVRTAAWIVSAETSTDLAWMTCDSVTGTILNYQTETLQTPKTVRVVTVGPWTHVLCSDSTMADLVMRSFHQDSPGNIISRSLGAASIQFDVKKVSEQNFVVGRIDSNVITMLLLKSDGSTTTTFVPDLDGSAHPSVLAFAVNADGEVGLLWSDSTDMEVHFRIFNTAGGVLCDRRTVTGIGTVRRLTVVDEYLRNASNASYWAAFVEDTDGINPVKVSTYELNSTPTSSLRQVRHQVVLASHAFRVGQRAYTWLATPKTLQSTWFLCDRMLLPIGQMDYGTANIDSTTGLNTLPSVNWTVTSTDHPAKDRLVFFGCLPYRLRVTSNPPTNGVFAEPSIRVYTLDFLPYLRSAQAGRSTYIAGAQLWQYDGLHLTEANFHVAPEGIDYTPATGGSLSSDGEYRYRVDLCHKNAKNEEIRSLSLISDAVVMGASDTQVTLVIPTMPMTRRPDSYFLVFRTELNQTGYYAVSSRNSADTGLSENGFVPNDQSVATQTFVDQLSDEDLISREYHPANAGDTYLQPFPAPACEVVAAGRDRLWVAGGELNPGEVAPSRLYQVGETPCFSPALNVVVDRAVEPITAIGFMGDVAAVFRKQSTYILDSDGPDNLAQGGWAPARLALSDVGAISQDAIAFTSAGMFFQSTAGIRLLSPTGAMVSTVGSDVDILSVGTVYSAAVVSSEFAQVRFYSREPSKPTLVYHYDTDTWVTWTGLESVGAANNTAFILARPDGQLWVEVEGRYTDDDRPYESKVRSAWLHAGALGDFQRIRRWALFGLGLGELTFKARLFYDERPFFSEETSVNFPGGSDSAFNTSVWGGSNWGSGSWGDSDNVNGEAGLYFRDNTFRLRRMPRRQKCSVFSIEFSDNSCTTAGFVPIVLALELGTKRGLDRIPGAAAQV